MVNARSECSPFLWQLPWSLAGLSKLPSVLMKWPNSDSPGRLWGSKYVVLRKLLTSSYDFLHSPGRQELASEKCFAAQKSWTVGGNDQSSHRLWPWQRSPLVFYCCQNKSHEFGSSHLLSHNSVTQKSRYSVAWLGPLFRVSQGWNQAISRTPFLREGSGEESASKLTQIVGKFSSLGLQNWGPCSLAGCQQGATLCSSRSLLSPCTWLLHSKPTKTHWNPLTTESPWLPPSTSSLWLHPERDVCFLRAQMIRLGPHG